MSSSVIGALRVNLSADTAEFKRGLTEAERMADRVGKALSTSMKAGALAMSAGATAAATALIGLTKASFETISSQVDLASRVGASVAAIQVLEHAAQLAGASQQALATSLGTLNARLGEAAREGAGPAYEALQRLGLSARELSEMDADERIKALSDRMAELGLNTQAQADTLRDLGIRQQEIIGLFQEGSQAIDHARQELKGWGVLLSDVDARRVEEASDSWSKLGTVLQGVGNQVAVGLAPAIKDLATLIGDFAKQGNIAERVANGMKEAFSEFSEKVARDSALIETFKRRIELAKEVVSSFRIGEAGGVDWEAFRTAHASAATDIGKIWSDLDAKLQKLAGPDTLIKGLDDYLNRLNPLVQSVDAYIAKIKPAGINGGGGGGGGENRQAEELARYQEQLAQKLTTLQGSLMTEREAELAAYEQRLMDLEDFHARGMLSDAEYKDALIRNKAGLSEKLMHLDDEVARNNERAAQRQRRAYFQIADDIGSVLDSVFGESKLVAIAQAVINTAQAVTRNLAEYPGPTGFAMAAAAAAAGAAEIATMRSTTKSGGGGGGRGSSGGGASVAASQPAQSAASQSPQQAIYINLAGQSFGSEQVRGLIEQINDQVRDGVRLIVSP
ncbi:MAG: hypothetical protein AB7F09_15810 [Parvibaculaceae bacterium]